MQTTKITATTIAMIIENIRLLDIQLAIR
jgi:hypothetical protein